MFTNVLLADEINRATPRTQAGLLECMEERQVTIDGMTYPLKSPFFVIATQNPVETAGTFPLPEAQLDRFMMQLSMGLPTREEELSILKRYMKEEPLDTISSVLTQKELQDAKEEAANVYVHDCIQEYMTDIVMATRERDNILMGVSPRGALAMLRAVKAYACIQGRSYVIPDDVKAVAVPVLAHRILTSASYGNSKESQEIVADILQRISVPTEDFAV